MKWSARTPVGADSSFLSLSILVMRHLFLDTKLTSVYKLVENGPSVEKKSEVGKGSEKGH
jgi:hypothetical protein